MTLQEYLTSLRHKTVAVIGIGVSNTPLLRRLLAEGIVDYYVRTSPTYEWDTAAGELILSEAGGETRSLPDGGELKYNEEDLHNPWFVCRSKFCPAL